MCKNNLKRSLDQLRTQVEINEKLLTILKTVNVHNNNNNNNNINIGKLLSPIKSQVEQLSQ